MFMCIPSDIWIQQKKSYAILSNDNRRRCTQAFNISLSSFYRHARSASSEIKMAHCRCKIKIMALKSQSSWSSQNQPYGPLLLFLHAVPSNVLGEIKVQPASLCIDESTKLWFMTVIHPGCSHSNNRLGLKGLRALVFFFLTPSSMNRKKSPILL